MNSTYAVFDGISVFPINRGPQVSSLFDRTPGAVGTQFIVGFEETAEFTGLAVVQWATGDFAVKDEMPEGVTFVWQTDRMTDAFEAMRLADEWDPIR